MSHSKLTSKFQTTIPQEIRTLLGLKAGDQVVFEVVEGDQVVIRKAMPIDLMYLKSLESTLGEWGSEYDEEAYRDL